MAIYLLFILLILVIIHFSIRLSKEGKLVDRIPGPTGLPVIGNLLLFLNHDTASMWDLLRKLMKKYRPLGKLWFGPFPFVTSQDPDDLGILLQDKVNVNKSRMYQNLKPWLKEGLVTSTREKWKNRRKLLTPAFHPNVLKKYLEISQEQVAKFIENLSSQGDESVQEVIPLLSNLTLNIICASAMNINPQTVEGDMKEYKSKVDEYLEIVLIRSLKPYLLDFMKKFVAVVKKQFKYAEELHFFTDKIISERRKQHVIQKDQTLEDFVNKMDEYETKVEGNNKKIAMLDLLFILEDQGLIDAEGIREEVDTFTYGGHDSTALSLSYLLALLAENKNSQDLARAEALDMMKQCNGKMTYSDVSKLDYIDRCVKEGLRLFPTFPHILRVINKDLHLKNHTIPAGTNFMISIYDMHHDAQYWPEPEKFDPDRFLPENIEKRNPFAYIPFSAGPRSCIGKTFATMEAKTLLAHILCNFYIEPVMSTKDIKFKISLALQPRKPVRVKFVKINKK